MGDDGSGSEGEEEPVASGRTTGGGDTSEEEEASGDTFDVTVGTVAVTVRKGETMGAVSRRMSVETGLSPAQMAKLLGVEDAAEDETVDGRLSSSSVIQLPQHAGTVECQFKGKGKFVQVQLSLTNGDLVFQQKGQKHDRTASAVGCALAFPKKARKGHEHAFRIDLTKKDSNKCEKYIFSVESEDELTLWVDTFGAYSAMSPEEVAAALEAEVAAAELRPVVGSDEDEEDEEDEEEDDEEDEEDEEDEDADEEGGGDTFGDDADSFGVMVDGKEFRVSTRETMGAVKRRMSVSTGLSESQLGKLLGADDTSEDQTVAAAGVLSSSTSIMLPQHQGTIELQAAGKGKFKPRHLAIVKGEMEIREGGPQGKLKRIGTVLGCQVDVPKKARKGHEHAFRVDLGKKDNKKETKYVISVTGAEELKRWMDCFGAYSSMTVEDIAQVEKEAAESAERELLRADADADEDEDEDEDEEESSDEEVAGPPPIPPLRVSLHSPRPVASSVESQQGRHITVAESPLVPAERSLVVSVDTMSALEEALANELEVELELDGPLRLEQWIEKMDDFMEVEDIEDLTEPCRLRVSTAAAGGGGLSGIRQSMDEAIGCGDLDLVRSTIVAAEAWPNPQDLLPAFDTLRAYGESLEQIEAAKAEDRSNVPPDRQAVQNQHQEEPE